MRIGLDGLPLTAPKTGVGHYTFELAHALAKIEPSSQFEVVYPSTYEPIALETSAALPENLKLNHVRVGPLGRHWWSTGLAALPAQQRPRAFSRHQLRHSLVASLRDGADYSRSLSTDLSGDSCEAKRESRPGAVCRSWPAAADAIITPSESVRREVCELLKADAAKVFAIPEAARACFRPMDFAETENVRRELGVSDDFLLTVGTLEPRKNLDVLVNAFAEVARALPLRNTQLVIAGGRGWLSGPLLHDDKAFARASPDCAH